MNFLRNLFGNKSAPEKAGTGSTTRRKKSLKVKSYTYGFIKEFGDVDRAEQYFKNLLEYLQANVPTFPCGICFADGIIPTKSGDEERTWVLFMYDMNYDGDATPYMLSFQSSPLYLTSYDDYMFTPLRQRLFYAAIKKGKMKVLDNYESSPAPAKNKSAVGRSESVAEKARRAGELQLLRQPVPWEWKSDLLLALVDEDVVARRWAASALESFNSPEVIEALTAAIDDQDTNVRCNAGISLFHLKGIEARPILDQMLVNETSDYVRQNITALITDR